MSAATDRNKTAMPKAVKKDAANAASKKTPTAKNLKDSISAGMGKQHRAS